MLSVNSWVLSLLLFLVISCTVSEGSHAKNGLYGWRPYDPKTHPRYKEVKDKAFPKLNGTLGSAIIKQKVYASITTVSFRVQQIHKTILAVLSGPVVPDHLYLFMSPNAYLLDEGVDDTDISLELMSLVVHYPVTIVFVHNIGPHRKLLPLLDRKWTEDCVIITLDDEPQYWLGNYISQLLAYYLVSERSSVVTLKARRIAFCSEYPNKFLPYTQWGEAAFGMHEYFLLPTGTGGILYRPIFFHPVVFDPNLIAVTATTDDITFRLATMVKGVMVVTGCRRVEDKNNTRYEHVGSILTHDCTGTIEIAKSFTASPALTVTPRNMSLLPTVSAKVQRRLELSLYKNLNMRNGNDKSIHAGIRHLETLGLMNMPVFTQSILHLERPGCDKNSKIRQKYPGGEMACMFHPCQRHKLFW